MNNNKTRLAPLHLVSLVTTDMAGMTRGRSLPEAELEDQLSTGCGWVPANSALTPQDVIASDNPWGSHGDLRLLPDLASRARVAAGPDADAPPLDFVQGNLVETDGTPWPVCPRTLLNDEIERYRAQFGLKVLAAFEHEFNLLGLPSQEPTAPAFSLQAQRILGNFPGWLMSALDEAGAEPEMFLPEYGHAQYEVTCRPIHGVAAADRAVIVREVTREIARQSGLRSCFSPLMQVGGVTTGVHLHISLQTLEGAPVMYQSGAENDLSPLAKHWAAGVLRHLPALCAITAPTAISYLRLKPHQWSSSYACLGSRNREAALRICPVTRLGGRDPARQFNLEYRSMDATASPHLAMAAVLIAGRLGIEQQLPLGAVTDIDPDSMSEEERNIRGICALPQDLASALKLLTDDQQLCEQIPGPLLQTYFAMKREELALTKDMSAEELCVRYANLY